MSNLINYLKYFQSSIRTIKIFQVHLSRCVITIIIHLHVNKQFRNSFIESSGLTSTAVTEFLIFSLPVSTHSGQLTSISNVTPSPFHFVTLLVFIYPLCMQMPLCDSYNIYILPSKSRFQKGCYQIPCACPYKHWRIWRPAKSFFHSKHLLHSKHSSKCELRRLLEGNFRPISSQNSQSR